MKKFTSLIIAVICIAMMIGGWVWVLYGSSGPGSMGIALVPPMIITTIGLFIASIILIVEFFKSLKTDVFLTTEPSDEMYIPKELPAKKNYKALAGFIVQIAAIVALAIWLLCDPIGIIFSLPAIAVIIALALGAELCLEKFRRSLK